MKNLYFDIETTGLDPWGGHIITTVCARDTDGKTFEQVLNVQSPKEFLMIDEFLDWVLEHPPDFYQLVTKNGKKFDIPFILSRGAMLRIMAPAHEDVLLRKASRLMDYKHVDFQELTKKWISLEDLCKILQIRGKLGDGLNAIKLWENGQTAALLQYCVQDVKILEDVWKRIQYLKNYEG